jgi:phosphatidylserine decarboxylase
MYSIHKEGRWYCLAASVILFVLLTAIAQLFPGWGLGFWLLSVPFIALWFWVFWFFRIPVKKFLNDVNAITSPCDGKVVVIEEVFESEYYKDKRLQISA